MDYKRVLFTITGVLILINFLDTISAEGANVTQNFTPELIIPVSIAFAATLFLSRYMLPISLSSLQVAFEADTNLYEVHRLTKTSKDARKMLKLPGVRWGILAYLMAMMGLMVLIMELLINADTYYYPVVGLMFLLIGIPVFFSPWETMIAQLDQLRRNDRKANWFVRIFRRFWAFFIIGGGTLAVLWYGYKTQGTWLNPTWITYALLVFMSPTIFAYGRIVGASWNMLVLSKWRTVKGNKTPINPDKPSIFSRIGSLILVIFLVSMPLTAINGILTVTYVIFGTFDDVTMSEILNYGGIFGYKITNSAQLQDLIEKWQWLKNVPTMLALYLSLNVAIVGLAFIFELIRNLFLGGQDIGGNGGVRLASTREIRSEDKVQSKLLYFAFAGFSGYTVLLVVLTCYKEFSTLMPYTEYLEKIGFNELMILQTTWTFIAAGQTIFLIVWILSAGRFLSLRNVKFDLAPDERRKGAFRKGKGDWMKDFVDQAALNEDLDQLIRFQNESISGDQSMVRLAKSRARMHEYAIRGIWPTTIEEARKVLAQQGGNDDEARMIMAVGHLACRTIDAAKEILYELIQDDEYDEPETMNFVADYLDPWQGKIDNDDLWDWEANSVIDNVRDLVDRLTYWSPRSRNPSANTDRLTLISEISQVATMRAQRLNEKALDLAISVLKKNPQLVRARIAVALCLIDRGDWYMALDLYESLSEIAAADPRVDALGEILGIESNSSEFEVVLAKGKTKNMKDLIDKVPANPIIALNSPKSNDVALNANVMVAADAAVMKGLNPQYSKGFFGQLINISLILPLIALSGYYANQYVNRPLIGIITSSSLFFMYIFTRRLRRSQRRLIRHRDQKAMVAYSKRMRRNRVSLDPSKVPAGNHLLLSGILVTVNKVVYDIGFPGWMVKRIERVRSIKTSLRKRSQAMANSKAPRFKPLPSRWWKEHGRSIFNEDEKLKSKIENIILRKSKIGNKKKKRKGRPSRKPGKPLPPGRRENNEPVNFGGTPFESTQNVTEEYIEEDYSREYQEERPKNTEGGFSIDSFLSNRRKTQEQLDNSKNKNEHDFSF